MRLGATMPPNTRQFGPVVVLVGVLLLLALLYELVVHRAGEPRPARSGYPVLVPGAADPGKSPVNGPAMVDKRPRPDQNDRCANDANEVSATIDPALLDDVGHLEQVCMEGGDINETIARIEKSLQDGIRVSLPQARLLLERLGSRDGRALFLIVLARIDPAMFATLRAEFGQDDRKRVVVAGLLGLVIDRGTSPQTDSARELYWLEVFNGLLFQSEAPIEELWMFQRHVGPATSPQALDTLLSEMTHADDPSLRALCALFLKPSRTNNGEEVRKGYIDLLSRDPSPSVRALAIQLLSGDTAPTTVRALKTVLETDSSEDVRADAIRALQETSDSRIAEYLIGRYPDTPGLAERRAILSGLGRSSLPAATQFLASELKTQAALVHDRTDTGPVVLQHEAIRALSARHDDPAATSAVLDALSSPDWTIRDEAVDALEKMGDPLAIGRLEQVAEADPKEYVRRSASQALKRLAK